MSSLIITLIRHGKVDGPAALYGRTDIPLSAVGHRDLTRTLSNLHAQTPIDQMISSPRIRCSQVAHAFSVEHKIPLRTEDKLQEMDFGIWDGIPFDALGDEWKNIEAFWESPHRIQPPQGESLTGFSTRVIAGWELLINNKEAGHAAIICHGGVIRILIAHLLQLDWRNPALFKQLHIDYASCTRIEIGHYDGALPVVKWIGVIASN